MYLSELLEKKIITQSGKVLGNVQNVEVALIREKNKNSLGEIQYVVYGKRGFFERFGWKRAQGDKIAWKDIVKIEEYAIFVKEK